MSEYRHRIETVEEKTRLPEPEVSTAGLMVVIGTAPINMASDPKAVVNKPVLVSTFEEAKAAVGYSNDFKHYTLCQSISACFEIFGVAPVVLINVLNPEKHKKDYTKEIDVVAKVATIADEGIMIDTLKVATEADAQLTADTDYLASFNDDGGVDIVLLSTDKVANLKKLKVTATQLDPEAVTSEDIIGAYDVEKGIETGIETIRQVYPRFGRPPGFILAPDWSADPVVAAVLDGKTEGINGVYTCEALIDMDCTTVTVYTKLADAKEKMGIKGAHDILLWPKCKDAEGRIYAFSAVYAAMAMREDASNNDVPKRSPSNKMLGMAAAVLADGTEIFMDIPMAEVANANGIVTAINDGGWKAWGNNTACYPDNTDPKDRWIPCRRMMSWYRNRFIMAYRDKVSDPIETRVIEALLSSENQYLSSLADNADIAGGSISYNEVDNPMEQLVNGMVVFRTAIAFYTPAERIKDVIQFDANLLTSALSTEGGNE